METVIISVGGSLIVPDAIDTAFIQALQQTLAKHDMRFIIIAGGGKTARRYQEAAQKITKLAPQDLDWVGIAATTLNAQLLHTVFDDVHPAVIHNPTKKIAFHEKVLIAAGWKPGCSTDTDAVLLAKNFGVKKVVNLSNIEYVYDKDPSTHPDAQPIKTISWADFRKLLPNEWKPGLNSPFDPIAAEKAEQLGIEVVIMNGNMENLDNYLHGKTCIGTLIT